MKEMKAYTVAIGNLSTMKKYEESNKRLVEILKSLDGFIGVHPVYPNGTLLLFREKNDAIRAKNILEAEGVNCGNNICECFIPVNGDEK